MTTRNRPSRLLLAATLGLALGACEFISPIEGNPNAVASASVDQLFTGAQVNLIFFAEGQLSRLSSMWTQQMTGVDRQFEALDNYTLTESDADDDFERIYTQGGLIDIRSAIAQAEAAGRAPYAGILKIHEAYIIGMAASFWGDLPYSQAVDQNVSSPALDDQPAVYAAVQSLLDVAITDLGGAGGGPGSVDLAFGGNTAGWIAVARTLKARFHMHMAELDNARYATARTEAQSGITAAAGNWKAQHSTAATENNLWYQFFRDRSGYIGAGDFLGPMLVADSDARLPLYFSQIGTPPAYVFTTDVRSLLADPGLGESNYDFPIATCSENQFIIAEVEARVGTAAAAWAAAAAALNCQEAEHGLAATALDSQAAAITGLTGTALLNAIMRQKYIAMFLNPEALNDYKRSCQPGFTPRAGGVPRRLFYGQQERQTNTNIPDVGAQPVANDNDPNPCP